MQGDFSLEARTAAAPPAPLVRWMLRCDIDAIAAIESHSPGGWGKDTIRAQCQSPLSLGRIAEIHDRVVGWMLYRVDRPRRIVLSRLAVHPDYRRLGIGLALSSKVRERLHPDRRPRATARVADTNLDAHLFLRAAGWRATKVVRGELGQPDQYQFMLSPEAAFMSPDFACEGTGLDPMLFGLGPFGRE